MTIRTRIIGSSAIILIIFAGISLNNYARSSRANQRLALVNELFLPLSRIIVQLQSNLHGMAEDSRRYLYSQNPGASEGGTFSRMVKDLYPYVIERKFKEAISLVQKEQKNVVLSSEVLSILNTTKEHFDKMTSANGKERFEQEYSKVRTHLKRLLLRVDDECHRITSAAQADGSQNLFATTILALVALLFGLFAMGVSHKSLSSLPLLISSIRKITDGDFGESLKVKTNDKDEVASLAREFNRMLIALRERDKKIRAQQSELVQAERLAAVGQLSAEIVHEIRNPLNSISLNIDWLDGELQTASGEIKETLRSISREIERLNLISESYLVRARVPSTSQRRTNANDLLNEIVSFTKEEHKKQNIRVKLQLSDRPIMVKAERSRLKQAFINVFRNATEAMPNGGVLTVNSRVKNNICQVIVTDSGYGMNESTRAKTFRPFFTTKQNGTGLGLMLTRTIVEEANGSVQCESKMGRGTTFTFQFPV